MRAHGTRVLMLGWEYPPRFAGGLGKACQGLAQAMARAGARIYFILPTFPEHLSEPHLEVMGARECLAEAGWAPEAFDLPGGPEVDQAAPGLAGQAGVSLIGFRAQGGMHPYARPEGPAPESLSRGESADVARSEARREKLRSAWRGRQGKPAPRGEGRSPRVEGERGGARVSSQGFGRVFGEIYGKSLWSDIERFALMARHLADAHEVDVVHAHDWMAFPAAFEFQRVTGVPVFAHVHATEYDRSGENPNNDVFRIEREGFRRATHIFAVSRYTAGIIERLYGINRKKITVVYNAPEDSMRALVGRPDAPRKPQVIFLGRLTFQKGPDHFLRAAALVAQASPEARFILCGSGDMLDQLRSLSHRLGIEEKTHFAGFVDPSGVDELLIHSKVLVMPSVSEPFGLVALEAIRCGLPVIISKQSGVREVLHRALQVDFWDHEKLADQILAALRLAGLSRQLVDEGMDQMRELSWDRSAQRVLETYQRFRNSGGSTYAAAVGGGHGH